MTGKQRGFSLVEMTVAMAVMLIVIGGVLQLLNQSQQRYVSTANVEDATATAREALDQMVREVRLAGYPAANSYPAGIITSANQQYVATAGGFLAASNYAIQFEADSNNSGVVTVVDYQLQVPTGGATGGCTGLTVNAALTTPTLMRSAVLKNANGAAVTPVFQPFVDNVVNCTQATPAPIFTMCPAPPAAAVAGCPDMTAMRVSSLPAPGNTRIVRIRLQVQTLNQDPQTGQFQIVEFANLAQRVNPDQ